MRVSVAYAPLPNQSFVCSSGNSYLSDSKNIITGIASVADQNDLENAGCIVLTPPSSNLLFTLKSADFNSTADQILSPTFKGQFRVTKIVVMNTSVNGMATAVGGIYSASAKATGQGIIVAAGQAYTGLTNSQTALELTLALASLVLRSGTSLYFSLTTAHGSTATADIYVYGEVYDA